MNSKILPTHLERQAYVYIRQSSPRQVEQHLESQDLQYQLVHRAQALGWDESRIVVIDDDLGKSAISATQRHGFQSLVAAVGLNQVGLILVTDVSRLARNCQDWYHLLDLASLCGTLLSDASGIYDPRNYDDRLLLGLKGTFSEAQWYSMRSQLYAAQLNKARRGELALRLPVGYERLSDSQVVLAADQQVQAAIRLVFDTFDQTGSVRAVLRHWRDQGLQLPRLIQTGPARGDIEWVRPNYQGLYAILKHPGYAGAYAYGKHHRTRLPGDAQRVVTRSLPRAEWPVLKPDAWPAYITWEHYLQNQTRLQDNAQGAGWRRGAPHSGAALLQGLVVCACCGRAMHVHYTRNSPHYVCDTANRNQGDPRCQVFTIAHIDQAVTEVFLQAVQPAHLEAALAAVEQVEAQRRSVQVHWAQRLDRAHYEADLARRRYERVDPDLRLVAAELERQWEDKLHAGRALEREWAQAQARQAAPLSDADKQLIRRLAEDVPGLWHAPTTTAEDRKRLMRCLIQDVTLDSVSQPGASRLLICWHTGTTTTLEVPRPKPGHPTTPVMVERITELAQHYPDDQIAAILNAEGLRTALGHAWTLGRVRSVRGKFHIPTACPYVTAESGPRGDGLVKATEAAQRLGVTFTVIADWFRRGLLGGHQRQPGTPLWIRLMDEDVRRLDGSAARTPDLIPLEQAPEALGLTVEQMREEIRAGKILTYRLLIHRDWDKGWRWFVQRPELPSIPNSVL
jgi:DNA invertase Pin-like site-specific DNA recombinase